MKTDIHYTTSLDGLTADQLMGFFVGWPNPPSPETFLRLLGGSSHRVLAIDSASGDVIGFITAISDGVLSAYIPLLEVLPPYQGQGIGSELTRRMLLELNKFYMIDLACDATLASYYERFGMVKTTAMIRRNYVNQSGSEKNFGGLDGAT